MSDGVGLTERYHAILKEISDASARGKSKNPVTLIAVSKFQSVDAIEALYRAGHRDFGENYVQELLEKNAILSDRGIRDIRWHFIGHLQKNKIKSLLPFVFAIHTIDSLGLALEIVKRWSNLKTPHPLKVFLEVNLHGEPSKAGFAPNQVRENAEKIAHLQGLEILGLMCIPDPGQDSRQSFSALRDLELLCRPYTESQLSMGMSNDYEIAIEEGASHVRIGTALFGERRHH